MLTHRNSLQKSLCPVVICPCVALADSTTASHKANARRGKSLADALGRARQLALLELFLARLERRAADFQGKDSHAKDHLKQI